MKVAPARTTLCNDEIPSNLRPFIEILLNGTYETSSESTPPVSLWDVNERKTKE